MTQEVTQEVMTPETITSLLEEVDTILTILEEAVPGNPNAPKNKKLQDRLQRKLAKYFKRVQLALDQEAIEELYRNLEMEALQKES